MGVSAVPEKSEGEEQQNAITARPEKDTSTKKNKPTPTRTTLPGSPLLSSKHSSNSSSSTQSENFRKHQSVFEQQRPQPRNTTGHESLKKLNTPSIITTTSSPQKQFVTSLAAQSRTSASKPVTQSSSFTVKPQTLTPPKQSTTTLTRQNPTTPTRIPFTSTSPIVTQSVKPVTAPHRPSFTPTTKHSFIPTTEAAILPKKIPTTPASSTVTPNAEFTDNKDIIHTHTEVPFFSVTKNLTLPSFPPKIHAPQGGENPIQTEQPSKGLNMMPSSVARSPGNKFSFTSHKEKEPVLTPEELQRVVFQPLLARPRTKTRRILTSAPSLLPIDPGNSSDPHHHLFPMRIEFHAPAIPEDSLSRDSLDFKLSNSQRVQTPSPLLQPPSETSVSHPLSSFLSPPTHPFTPITRMKQEFPTLLEIPPETSNIRTSPRDTFLPGARRLPFPPPSQGNRDFFIPSAEFSLLVSEVPLNNVEERILNPTSEVGSHHQDHHGGSHMTMVFPAPIEPSKMEELKLNPECPRCHPEFLKPGQCHPCVVIK